MAAIAVAVDVFKSDYEVLVLKRKITLFRAIVAEQCALDLVEKIVGMPKKWADRWLNHFESNIVIIIILFHWTKKSPFWVK